MSNISEVVKHQFANMLDAEARAIQEDHYNYKNPENLERIKLALSTMLDLTGKGLKMIPASSDEKVIQGFPDVSKLDLPGLAAKQIVDKTNWSMPGNLPIP